MEAPTGMPRGSRRGDELEKVPDTSARKGFTLELARILSTTGVETSSTNTIQGSMADVLRSLPELANNNETRAGVQTLIWMGHGGLDAFMGALAGIGISTITNVLIFTCNAKDYELPAEKDIRDAAKGIRGLQFVVLDTLSPQDALRKTIAEKLETVDMKTALILHGESGMDIFCAGTFQEDKYSACLDFYEDFMFPSLMEQACPEHTQYVVVTNPGLDLRKGADRGEFVGELEVFDSLAKKRFEWELDMLREVPEDAPDGKPIHEIIGAPRFDEWFLGLTLETGDESELKCALQRLKKQGMRLSVALGHDLLFQQGAVLVPPIYQVFKLAFETPTAPPITPGEIFKMRAISPTIASKFDRSGGELHDKLVQRALALKGNPLKFQAVCGLLALKEKYNSSPEGSMLAREDSATIAEYATGAFRIKKFGQNPNAVTAADFETKFELDLLLASAYPGGGREIGQAMELLLLSCQGSRVLGEDLASPTGSMASILQVANVNVHI